MAPEPSSSTRPAGRAFATAVLYLAAVAVVAALGGLATAAGQGPDGWYEQADKPWFTPPGWVFGPVWTVLYLAMAAAGWLLSAARDRGRQAASTALALWWVQLALNLAWTPLFFAARLLWPALVDIVVLVLVLGVLVARARRVSRLAAWLLAPYLAWVLFATALNAGVAWLNR